MTGRRVVMAGPAAAFGLAAIGLGCLHLLLVGAPPTYPAINAVAAVLALLAGAGLRSRSEFWALAGGAAVLATALLGTPVEGIARWVALGPLRLQPSLILVPPLVIAFARRPGWAHGLALAMALVALGLQPDRGTAGAAALALVLIVPGRSSHAVRGMAVLAVAVFGWTLLRPDSLGGVRFVEDVFVAARGRPAAVVVLALGVIAMLAPGAIRWMERPRDCAGVAMIAIWAGLLIAAAAGAYPTPVLGYGASGVIGFVLSMLVL